MFVNELFEFQADWFFPENVNEENMPVPVPMPDESEEFESNTNQALLLHNISKYEGWYIFVLLQIHGQLVDHNNIH